MLTLRALDTAHIEVLEATLKANGEALDRQKLISTCLAESLVISTDRLRDAREESGRLERELAQQEELIHVLQANTPVRDELGRFTRVRTTGLLDGIFGDGESNEYGGSDREGGQATISPAGCC